MRNYILAFLVVLISLPLWAKAEDVLLMDRFVEGKVERYSVPRKKAARLPRWNNTRRPVPLSQQSAVRIAEKRLSKLYPETKIWDPQSVALSTSVRKDQDYVWYYTVTLKQGDSGSKGIKDTVVVLLDGSIVDPKPLQN